MSVGKLIADLPETVIPEKLEPTELSPSMDDPRRKKEFSSLLALIARKHKMKEKEDKFHFRKGY